MSSVIDWSGPARQPCPACDRGARDRALGVTINPDGTGVAWCFRCEFVELLRDDRQTLQARQPRAVPAQQPKHERLSEFGAALWAECRPIAGAALSYLQARACVIPPADGDLRWHPALRHPPSGTHAPALVALVTDAVTGQPLMLHRTWIGADGKKARLDPPRMLLGGHRKQGGVIRLWPDEAVAAGLGVAEGIETALALAHAHKPVWALIDAGNLAELPVLAGIECLTIAADHDDAGIAAANTCAERWTRAGGTAYILLPPDPKSDLNDLVRAA